MKFRYRNFRDTKCYDDIYPVSNQPACFFATAKTHEFNSIEEINVDDLKLHPITDQTGCCIYNILKIIARYLKPLTKNDFAISDILTFPDLNKEFN